MSLNSTKVSIQYRDQLGWYSSLSSLYFSTSSSTLISKNPLQTIEDTISYYCPQCFTRLTPEDAQSQYYQCIYCYQCPCEGILIQAKREEGEGEDILKCYSCCSSFDIPSISAISSLNNKIKISKDFINLYHYYNDKMKKSSLSSSLFSTDPLSSLLSSSSIPSSSSQDKMFKWNFESLENKLKKSDKTDSEPFFTTSSSNSSILPFLSVLNHPDPSIDISLSAISTSISSSPTTTSYPINLVKPIKLRKKKTIRSRFDFEATRSNILVQPHPFPLDGDSSQRIGVGKFFVKESLAIHFFPQIQVLAPLPSYENLFQSLDQESTHNIHLRITNPKEKKIKIKFLPINPSNIESIITKSSSSSTISPVSISTQLNIDDFLYEIYQGNGLENNYLLEYQPIQPPSLIYLPSTFSPSPSSSSDTLFETFIDSYIDELFRDDAVETTIASSTSSSSTSWKILNRNHNIVDVSFPVKLLKDLVNKDNRRRVKEEKLIVPLVIEYCEDDEDSKTNDPLFFYLKINIEMSH